MRLPFDEPATYEIDGGAPKGRVERKKRRFLGYKQFDERVADRTREIRLLGEISSERRAKHAQHDYRRRLVAAHLMEAAKLAAAALLRSISRRARLRLVADARLVCEARRDAQLWQLGGAASLPRRNRWRGSWRWRGSGLVMIAGGGG